MRRFCTISFIFEAFFEAFFSFFLSFFEFFYVPCAIFYAFLMSVECEKYSSEIRKTRRKINQIFIAMN